MEIIVDTSAIIEGVVSEWIEEGKEIRKIYLHRAVISELNHQANQGRITGFLGLEEIKRIRKLAEERGIEVEVVGDYPSKRQIELAKIGEIDLMIIEYAYNEGLTLVTSDRVQAETARAFGVDVIFFEPKTFKYLEFERFFDEETMSVHLKEGCKPVAKKGRPGKWRFVTISDEFLSKEHLEKLAMDIIEFARQDPNSFVEIERGTTTIVQLRNYRIIICRPPFSDGWEITIVRPIKKLKLEDYNLPEKLLKRLEEKAEGILIAGPPGAGKCVHEETILKTEMGEMKAKDLFEKLQNGEKIRVLTLRMNRYEFKNIVRWFKRKAKILIKIRTKSGKEIMLTPNHPVLAITRNGIGWIAARYLEKEDVIACFGEDDFVPVHGPLSSFFDKKFVKKSEISSLIEKLSPREIFYQELAPKLSLITNKFIKWERIESAERISGEFDVYDFECEEIHNFIANGFIVHNSTFAQALAEFYAKKKKIVKTVESPRDLVLPNEITQYSKNYGTSEEIHDVLLLSRPDYTIFDEMRNDEDFKLYIDMRLAGVGMVGVVHASSPIDAIQRFIRRVELGQIPSIIDTVIFIKEGKVAKVYSVEMTVRVPTGLMERELARPVIEVRDFLSGELEYEIYKFGEETVVVPVKRLKKKRLENILRSFGIEHWKEENGKIIIFVEKSKIRTKRLKKLRNLVKILERKTGKEIEIELI